MNTLNQPKRLSSTKNQYKERQMIAMKKRIGTLKYRRERLTHELNAINSALFELNKQILNNDSFKQLSI